VGNYGCKLCGVPFPTPRILNTLSRPPNTCCGWISGGKGKLKQNEITPEEGQNQQEAVRGCHEGGLGVFRLKGWSEQGAVFAAAGKAGSRGTWL
jgi:hypothetical protein